MKKIIINLIYLLVIPLILYLGFVLYNLKQYHIISILIAIVSVVPFFINFEKSNIKIEKLVLIAAFTAITSVSRIIFNVIPLLPGFNPATAIIILIAIVFDKETGFMVGALTALISNNYLSHGPWTPFQMFSWGFIGYLAGVFKNILKTNILLLLIFGIFSAIIYSLLMDVYTVLSYDNAFRINRYIAVVTLSIPFIGIYILANVIFIILFSKLFIDRLERVIVKYGLK